MARVTFSQANFSAGELSPLMRGRFDLEIYYKSCSYMCNFYAQTQGPAVFRGGTFLAGVTRNNQRARIIRFQFNVLQAYILELTDRYMRIYKDGGLVTANGLTITGITKAATAVVTSAAHGLFNGEQVFIDGVQGMDEINVGGPFVVANVTTNTFELQGVNSTGFGTYTSGGTASRIIEIRTPWTLADLNEIEFAQTYDTMYVVKQGIAPIKITRTSHTDWTVKNYARTADPFGTLGTGTAISAITKAFPAQVTANGHGLVVGQNIIFDSVTGMTELRQQVAKVVSVIDVNNFTIDVDTRRYSTFTSGGTLYRFTIEDYPSAVTFFEQRIVYGGTTLNPQKIFFSKSNAYDDMTVGTQATDGMQYTLASEEVNAIQWLSSGQKYMVVGTYGGPFKVQGNDDSALTPNNIRVTPSTNFGCERQMPVKIDNVILFTQRGGETLRSFQYDTLADGFKAMDSNLVADHITESGIGGLALQTGRPDIIWGWLNNGRMVGLNYKQDEAIQGWFQYTTQGKFQSVATISQTTGGDQQWVATERIINGQVKHFVEYFKNQPVHPRKEDYYGAIGRIGENMQEVTQFKEVETEAYEWALYESQKDVYHVDCGLSASGLVTGITVTPSAMTGDTVTFTASGDFFQAGDVGNEIWAKGQNGRAEIVAYISPTQVTCKITRDFNSVAPLPSGGWYLTFNEILGLNHLEGMEVTICADGGTHPNRIVENGRVSLDQQTSVAHVGLGYSGLVISQNLEAGGNNGPAQTKPRNASGVGVQFSNSLECMVGTDFYMLERIEFYETGYVTGRPPLLYNGSKVQPLNDDWTNDKYLYIYQDKPLPCNVLGVIPYMTTNDT